MVFEVTDAYNFHSFHSHQAFYLQCQFRVTSS